MAELKYGKAVKKLDELILKIEDDQIDVDDLSDKVREAVELIRTCKAKIEKAEVDVRDVVEEFEPENE